MTTQQDADLEALLQWREGDRTAGDRLVKRYFGEIQRFFSRSVAEDVRQDLAQETFARLSKAKDRFQSNSSVRTFLFGIARHILHDHYRQRHQQYDPITQTMEDVRGATPSRALADLQQHERLLEGMQALPVDTKLMLEMYYWDDFTSEQLSEIYDIPAGTVRTRLHTARTRLREAAAKAESVKSAAAEPAAKTAQSDDDEIEARLRTIGRLLSSGPTAL
ncbi:MAG: sigma-70 family RNA polymerase sigma factor [Myxococcota bacterium]